jgi:hypothetical protein
MFVQGITLLLRECTTDLERGKAIILVSPEAYAEFRKAIPSYVASHEMFVRNGLIMAAPWLGGIHFEIRPKV